MAYSETLEDIVKDVSSKRHLRVIGFHLSNGKDLWIDRSLGEEIFPEESYVVVKTKSREELLPNQEVWKYYFIPYEYIGFIMAYDTKEPDEKIFGLEIKKSEKKRRRRRSSQK